MPDFNHLQTNILKSVSRSFYLSFLALPKEIRPTMSLGYLLCRAADTIADTPAFAFNERLTMLGSLKNLFTTFPVDQTKLGDFVRDLVYANAAPTTHEGKLLGRFEDCVLWFNALSKTDQALIQQVVLAVIAGMEMDLRTFGDSPETLKALATENDLETYIRWIGGQPGRFWSNVCLAHIPHLNIRERDRWIEDGIAFGTGLQLVNILRDLPNDLKNGRCYIPETLLKEQGLSPSDLLDDAKQSQFFNVYHDLIDQTKARLERGLFYMKQLPARPLGLRIAVWLPMTIGLKTLRRLKDSTKILGTENPVKINRREVYWLMAASLAAVNPICIERQIRRAATRS